MIVIACINCQNGNGITYDITEYNLCGATKVAFPQAFVLYRSLYNGSGRS
jgi:hypothetical protein